MSLPPCGSFQRLLLAAANCIQPAGITSHWPPPTHQQHTYSTRRHSHQLHTLHHRAYYNCTLPTQYVLLHRTACPFQPIVPSMDPLDPSSPTPSFRGNAPTPNKFITVLCTVPLGVIVLLLLLCCCLWPESCACQRGYIFFSSLLFPFLSLPSSYIPQPHTLVRLTHHRHTFPLPSHIHTPPSHIHTPPSHSTLSPLDGALMAFGAVGALTARTPDLTRRVSSALHMQPLHPDLSSTLLSSTTLALYHRPDRAATCRTRCHFTSLHLTPSHHLSRSTQAATHRTQRTHR
jgi:hypothetical protein